MANIFKTPEFNSHSLTMEFAVPYCVLNIYKYHLLHWNTCTINTPSINKRELNSLSSPICAFAHSLHTIRLVYFLKARYSISFYYNIHQFPPTTPFLTHFLKLAFLTFLYNSIQIHSFPPFLLSLSWNSISQTDVIKKFLIEYCFSYFPRLFR